MIPAPGTPRSRRACGPTTDLSCNALPAFDGHAYRTPHRRSEFPPAPPSPPAADRRGHAAMNIGARRGAPGRKGAAKARAIAPRAPAARPGLAAGASRAIARPAALYRQVVEALRRDMLEGVYPVGTHLPTEEELTARFSVSRNTVREALKELRNHGLVVSRRGSGTTVARLDTPATYVHDTGLLGDLYQYSRTRWAYTVEVKAIDEAMARMLETTPGEAWLSIAGFRYAENEATPTFWTQAWLHRDYSGITRLLARGIPIYQLIEDMYGDTFSQVDQLIRGQTAPEHVLGPLGLAPGSPVIEIARTYRIATGRIVEASSNLYPVNQFSLNIRLRRSVGA
jgi:GntR family transcriptional regulator